MSYYNQCLCPSSQGTSRGCVRVALMLVSKLGSSVPTLPPDSPIGRRAYGVSRSCRPMPRLPWSPKRPPVNVLGG